MRLLVFEGNTWTVYKELRYKDIKLHAALRLLLKEILNGNPSAGVGKPESLNHELCGLWSRRLSLGDRIIYKCDREAVYIFAIGGHFEQLGK